MDAYTRMMSTFTVLSLTIVLAAFCSAPCIGQDLTPVDGYYYTGEDPPPGSIVMREGGWFNHGGMVDHEGKIDDIVGRKEGEGPAQRYDNPYNEWRNESGAVSRGAWVPNLPENERIAIANTWTEMLKASSGYEVYPNNRGPDYLNCLAPIKAFEAHGYSLPVVDRPNLTPAEFWSGLTGVRMGGLQEFTLILQGDNATYSLGFPKFQVDVLLPANEHNQIMEAINALFRGEPQRGGGGPSGVGAGGGGSVRSGGGGGIESRPLWLGKMGILATQKALQSSYQTLQSSLLLQFIPTQGPRSELGQSVIPGDIIGNSNAINAIGMDYLDGAAGQVVASIFGAETLNSVYEHDYVVCSRVQNFELQTVLPFRYNLHWWWMARAEKSSNGYDELVIPLSIRLNGSQAIVDSRYLVDNYPSSVSGTVLNYQIRAADLPDALFFLDSILTTLAGSYTVSFANVSEPAPPTVFARRATYRNPNIKLVVENRGQAQSLRFFGPTWTEPRATAEQFVEFNIPVPNGISEVSLPVGAIHDAVIYIEAEDFLDKVYVASGYWFAWDDRSSGGTSQVSLQTAELQHAPIPGTDPSFVSPPLAEMIGAVTEALSWSHVGMGYTFQQSKEPIDLSTYGAVLFYARGDGKQYQVKLESAAVKDNDYHRALLLAEPEWKLVREPFSSLSQEGWGQPVRWTGKDIETMSFVTVGRPHESIHLVIDRISFETWIPFDWNSDGIISVVGDVPGFVNCVYFGNAPEGIDPIAVGDCNGDGILSIVGDVPCFVECVYFGSCPE